MTRIIRVFHTEEDRMYFDFFEKKEWPDIVKAFFLAGGLPIPDKVNQDKTIEELTEEDYAIFFEEIGYSVVNFEDIKKEDLFLLNTVTNFPDKEVLH
jgi:hypothetical protein